MHVVINKIRNINFIRSIPHVPHKIGRLPFLRRLECGDWHENVICEVIHEPLSRRVVLDTAIRDIATQIILEACICQELFFSKKVEFFGGGIIVELKPFTPIGGFDYNFMAEEVRSYGLRGVMKVGISIK